MSAYPYDKELRMLDRLASLFTAQENRLFQLHTAVKSEHELVLSSFTGAEGLSEDFGFSLDLACRPVT